MSKCGIARGAQANPRSAIWKRVGERLRAHRTELGLGVDQIAEELSIAPSRYAAYEAGKVEAPAMQLAQLADRFAVPVHWFFQEVVAAGSDPAGVGAAEDTSGGYRVATAEQRLRFLAEAFRRLDLESQQLVLAIVTALSQAAPRAERR